MLASARNQALAILKDCQTLAEADERLERAVNPHTSRATRWGLYDGYHGRPKSYAGLGAEPTLPSIKAKYDEAWEIGRELSMRELPA